MDKTEKAITFDNLPRRLPHREADGNVQKIFVYFQNCFCALMGKIVEIQQVYRVKLSKSRTLGCIPVHPGRRCTVPGKS